MPIINKYTYTDGSIIFSEISEPSMYVGQMIKNSKYEKDGNTILSTQPIINAIDIDWNKAYLPTVGSYINTTSELLSIIDNIGISSEVVEQIKKMIEEGIPKNLSDLINDVGYITYSDVEIPSYLSYFINDVGYITLTQLSNILRPYVTTDEILNNDDLKGKSAYQIAYEVAIANMENWPYKNESEWVESLNGEDGEQGDPGKSAYEITFETAIKYGYDFPYANENEWANDLNNVISIGNTISETITNIQSQINEKQDVLTAGNGIDITNNIISTTINEWLVIE